MGRTGVTARRFSSSRNLRMTEGSYESYTTYNVAQQRWQEEACKVLSPRCGMNHDHVEHSGRTCDDVVESAKPNQGRQNNDDTDARGICSGK